MAMTNGTDGSKRSVSSLGELSRNVTPPRDLWPSIASQIATDSSAAGVTERRRLRPTGMQWAALAAVVAALAVGVWLGRSVLSEGGAKAPVTVAKSTAPAGAPSGTASPANSSGPAGAASTDPNASAVLPASLVTDPRYTMRRAAMIRDLETQLKTLPPETQEKVASSLATIRTSIKDLQEALGRDPANALLQELLVNSYQDEMRVLTAVHEASGGI
jgi:hypothetical protein